jgi:MFS family permease
MAGRRVLGVRGFPLLLAGEAVNATGSWVAVIAIWGFAAFEFDAGAGDLALLFVVLSLPGAFLGPLLGVSIDRFGAKRMLVVANGLGMVNALALTQADSYLTIILLALPLGLIEALAAASLDSIPPQLMDDEHLVTANAFLGGAQDLAIIVGPILAAAVNVRWGLAGAFVVDAATFLVGAVVAGVLRVPRVPTCRRRGVTVAGGAGRVHARAPQRGVAVDAGCGRERLPAVGAVRAVGAALRARRARRVRHDVRGVAGDLRRRPRGRGAHARGGR